jgi:hypothetical protein
VKATSLGYLRYTEAKPQHKVSNVSFQRFNRQASGDCSGTKARRLEGAGPIYMNNNNNNKLGQFPSCQHPDWE